jgi:hypothetical protein
MVEIKMVDGSVFEIENYSIDELSIILYNTSINEKTFTLPDDGLILAVDKIVYINEVEKLNK